MVDCTLTVIGLIAFSVAYIFMCCLGGWILGTALYIMFRELFERR